jgi:hypothetical protein
VCGIRFSRWQAWLRYEYGYCYGVVSYKASHALRKFYDLSCVPIWIIIIPESFARALWLQQTHLAAKQEDGEKCHLIKPTQYLCHTLQGSLTWHKILWHRAEGSVCPRKKVALRICIALKNLSSLTGFEPASPVASTVTTRPPRTTILTTKQAWNFGRVK